MSNTPVLTRMCQKVAEKSKIIIAWTYLEVHDKMPQVKVGSMIFMFITRINHYKKIIQNATEINNARCSCMTGWMCMCWKGNHYKQCHELHTDYGLVTSVQMDIYSAFQQVKASFHTMLQEHFRDHTGQKQPHHSQHGHNERALEEGRTTDNRREGGCFGS